MRRSAEYFLGGRRFGPWVMVGQSFSVGTHAEMPVALAGAVYSIGASAIWYQWKNLFITPLYWIMAPVFRRIRRTTMAEFTEDRYGQVMGAVYIVFALCFFIIETGSLLKGAGKVISQATGGTTGVNEIVAAMTVMFVLYSFVGGLVASAWTDLFQGVLIIVLSFMLIPLGWHVVGGLDGMRASLPPFRFSLSTPSGIGPWVIAMLTVNGLVGIMAQPHMLATVGTGRDERTCRIGHAVRQFREARVHGRLDARRADCRRHGRAGQRTRAGGSRERIRICVPPAAVSWRARPADRLDSRGEHVGVLGVHGRRRRAVHRRPLSAAPRVRTAAIGTISGSDASAASPSRCSASCTRCS